MAEREVLSSRVKPSHYDLDLRNLDFTNWTYDGTVSINVQVFEPSKTIAINAIHLEFKRAEVLVDGSQVAQATDASSFEQDEKTQVVQINFDNEIPASKSVTIVIGFKGKIGDSLSGFYRCKYQPVEAQAASVVRDDDGSHYTLSTQLAASYARRAFPCFDAPSFKATFALTVEVPSDQVALSNMPVKSTAPSLGRDGWQVVSFETTPPMSTYLLAWAIGDFAYVEAFTDKLYNGDKIPVRLYTVRGIQHQGACALSMAPKVIDFFSEIFDIPYPLKKMDILAVPEMAMMGMEHWGLITAKPIEMLFDEKTSSEAMKRGIADNVCHELSHQWFGNLVTMDWWDELWLNEGFATWLGHYAVNYLFPEWDIWATFAVSRMENAFQIDGLRSSHPVHIPVSSGLRDHEIFDQISYGKGCAVIKMLEEYVGAGTFLKGVSKYLIANAYMNATARALWDAIGEVSGKDIVSMADSWITNVGYPVVTVTEDHEKGDITVRQSRFLISGDVKPEDDTTLWRISLGITGADDGQDAFLDTREKVISDINMDFYKINNEGTGFYRVNYPPSRLAKLSTQLDRLSAQDKISILGSAAAIATAGVSSMTSLLSFLQGFRQEDHYVVWEQVIEVLDLVDSAFAEDAQIREGLKRFTLQLLQDKVRNIGTEPLPEDTYLTRGLRRLLLFKAVRCGHESTLNTFTARFNDWASNGTEIEPSMRRITFGAAMTKDPAHALPIFKSELAKAPSSEIRSGILRSIAVSDDESTLQDLVAFNWSSSVPLMDMETAVFAMAYHPIGRHIQWAYAKEHWDACAAKIGDPLLLHQFVQVMMVGFSSEDIVKDMDAFFADKDADAFAKSLEEAREAIRARAALRERDSASLKQWLTDNKYL